MNKTDIGKKQTINEQWYGEKRAAELQNNEWLNTKLAVDGGGDIFYARFSEEFLPQNAEIITEAIGENKTAIKCLFKKAQVELFENFETFKTSKAVRQTNTIKNNGKNSYVLNFFSSARFQIDCDGALFWDDPKRFRVHFCRQGWATEGQMKSCTLRELGLAAVYDGSTRATVKFRSEGSWTTEQFYPLIIIEDLEKQVVYFAENESGGTWEILLGRTEHGIYVDLNCCSCEHDGWFFELSENTEYTSGSAVFGRVEGGLEEAVRELTAYKRETSLKKWENGAPLVCYNDYMNGTWGKPHANIYDMITAAGDAGCEVFCIDYGWFCEEGTLKLGDYYICDKNFAPYTFGDMIDHIKEKGMIPGVWFELESVRRGTELFEQEGCIRKRHGKTLCGDCSFYDMTNEKVQQHLLKFIRAVHEKGVRYIKNDYNQNTGLGSGKDGGIYNEESKRQTKAFYKFIDRIYKEFPDMIIENCGSGAMRSDNATLRNFTLQSVSDQNCYINYPSILQGSLAEMPPEKAGVWGFSVLGDYYKKYDDIDFSSRLPQMADGEQTVFNMVNAMMGCMYLSGWLDKADDYNKQLTKNAIDVYKGYRDMIARSHAVYPTGSIAICEKGFATLGLLSETDGEMILAVWKIGASEQSVAVDLSKYVTENASAELIYPAEKGCDFSFIGGRLSAKLCGNENMARLFKIKL